MSRCKAKAYVPDLFIGKEVVQVIPSYGWHGGKEFIGKKQDAVLIDGSYFDSTGGKFVMGEGHWELVEDNS